MNIFQKQLLLEDNKSMAELAGQYRDGVGWIISPQKISSEEFLRLMKVSEKIKNISKKSNIKIEVIEEKKRK